MRPFAEQRFDAMGTTAHVVVVGPDAQRQLGKAIERVFDLEQRWSRFLPTSEVSRLNAAHGSPTGVSRETLSLIEHGVAAWRLTSGHFDPTMVNQIEGAGYDRSFDDIELHMDIDIAAPPFAAISSRGCSDVDVDRRRSEVTLPTGVGFDPGGIGKGFAADIVTRELIDDRASGAMVNLGGDLAVKGLPPEGEDWVVTVIEPMVCSEPITMARLQNAGLATSTTAKRRWQTPNGDRHHLLDPATGQPTDETAVLATVIAGEAWWAEVSATAMLVSSDSSAANDADLEASMIVRSDGRVETSGDFARFES